MKVTIFGASLMFLIGNEILSMLAILVMLIAFLTEITKARIEK